MTAQSLLNHTPTIKPNVGAGVNYTRFYNIDLTPGHSASKHSFSGALQANVDIEVTQYGSLNFGVKKIRIDTDVSSHGVTLTNLAVNPVVRGIGYGFRF